MTDSSTVAVQSCRVHADVTLTFSGVLDGRTYRTIRDAVVKAALDGPSVLVMDVTALRAPSPSAWTAFTSARWLVARWPDVPMGLVCRDADGRRVLEANGITRYLPLFDSIDEAVDALTARLGPSVRRRARRNWPHDASAVPAMRHFVAEQLKDWGFDDMVPTASVVATVLVENVLAHTTSDPDVRVEACEDHVTIAVTDGSAQLAQIPEEAETSGTLTDLMMIHALATAWGNAPTADGKVVWAVLSPRSLI